MKAYLNYSLVCPECGCYMANLPWEGSHRRKISCINSECSNKATYLIPEIELEPAPESVQPAPFSET